MSFNEFFDAVVGKDIRVYLGDAEGNVECVFTMKPDDYGESDGRISLYGIDGSMLNLPINGEYEQDEEGFECITEKKNYIFSI